MRSLLAASARSGGGWRIVWPLRRRGGRDGCSSMSALFTRNRLIGLGLAGFVLALDQFVKWLVLVPLDLRRQASGAIELLPFFDLRYTENRGISLGLLEATSEEMRWILVGMTALIALEIGRAHV